MMSFLAAPALVRIRRLAWYAVAPAVLVELPAVAVVRVVHAGCAPVAVAAETAAVGTAAPVNLS
jgi:hypothetical protein